MISQGYPFLDQFKISNFLFIYLKEFNLVYESSCKKISDIDNY